MNCRCTSASPIRAAWGLLGSTWAHDRLRPALVRRDEVLGDAAPLVVVGVQQACRAAALQHGRQLPAQVVGVRPWTRRAAREACPTVSRVRGCLQEDRPGPARSASNPLVGRHLRRLMPNNRGVRFTRNRRTLVQARQSYACRMPRKPDVVAPAVRFLQGAPLHTGRGASRRQRSACLGAVAEFVAQVARSDNTRPPSAMHRGVHQAPATVVHRGEHAPPQRGRDRPGQPAVVGDQPQHRRPASDTTPCPPTSTVRSFAGVSSPRLRSCACWS